MKVFNTSLLLLLVALLLPINPGDSCPRSGISISYHEPNPQPQSPHIISRLQWNARTHSSSDAMDLPVKHVTIHHSATDDCYDETSCCNIVYDIQVEHMDIKGWWDIGYNFLIGGDGSIYEGRGWNRQGAHAGNAEYNCDGFGICMIGNFQLANPTSEALQALEQLIEYAVASNKLRPNYNVVGHRDVRQNKSTDCPGNWFYNTVVCMKNYGL